MRPITLYQADDGSNHATPEAALARDRLAVEAAEVMAPLGVPPADDRFYEGHGFIRRDLATVAAVRDALTELARRTFSEPDERLEFLTRMADETGVGPISRAWRRLCCIDETGREWGQPWYALNPDTAKSHEPYKDQAP